MKEHPIPFKTEMVQAILDGRKTQTRRIIKPQPVRINDDFDGTWEWKEKRHYYDDLTLFEALRKDIPYKVGDRLWVRETAWYPPIITEYMLKEGADTWPDVIYSADENNFDNFKEWGWKQKPSKFMPRWASRITLEIINIKVQRIQDITSDDVKAEGLGYEKNIIYNDLMLIDAYSILWDSLNKKRGYGWDENPWVWVISFGRL